MNKISLIGMSGAGKTQWAQKLASAGLRVISIDDRIEQRLAPELATGSHQGIGGVAAWMGWPDQPSYREHEQKYLRREIESMNAALTEIEESGDEGILLDTTGSVIYTGAPIRERLRALTTVVYLKVPAAEEDVLIARYTTDPKPVLWGDQYRPQPGESAKETVARCYPELIAQRKKLYERYAHRVVSLPRATGAKLDARGFLELLETPVRPA